MVSIPIIDALLVAARLSGMLYTVPILGSRNLPVIVRISLVFFLTLFVTPAVAGAVKYDLSTFFAFALLLLNELIHGLFIGLLISIYLNFIYFAGDLIDTQLGFSMISVINPLDESQMPITSNIFYVLFSLVFLVLNFHHRLILTMIKSFELIPLGSFFQSGLSVGMLFDVVQHSLLIGLQVAAPFLITVFIADIIMGMLSKAMPGMNIFVLGIPFKVLFGLIVFLLLVPLLFHVFSDYLSDAFRVLLDYIVGAGE